MSTCRWKLRCWPRPVRAGCAASEGLGMLLHQAVPGFHAWFGVKPEVDEELRRSCAD